MSKSNNPDQIDTETLVLAAARHLETETTKMMVMDAGLKQIFDTLADVLGPKTARDIAGPAMAQTKQAASVYALTQLQLMEVAHRLDSSIPSVKYN